MCYCQFFLTKLLILSILFSTGVRAAVVAKLVILGIFPLTSFILALGVVLLNLLESTGTGANSSISNLSTLLFKLLKSSGIVFNLSISNLSKLNFIRPTKSIF